MKRILSILGGVLFVLWVLVLQVFFMLDEREQAIITQFGAYVRTVTQPGLHIKAPFVHTVHRFDRRVLATDAQPAEYLTLDKKRVVVDYVARWRIADPLAFFKSVRTLEGARARIEDITFSELRRELASQDFAPVTSELREPTMAAVAQSSRERMAYFGIDLIDVRIKRADLPTEVQQSVFARMVAERSRIVKRYRSEGEEEAAKLRAETDKQREILLAQAYERSQRLRGEGDAAAAAIYARAYEQDSRFYLFVRTLEAYDEMLTPDTLLVLPGDAAMFRLLSHMPAAVDTGQQQR
jgi:modulator of FtsH protease HflC